MSKDSGGTRSSYPGKSNAAPKSYGLTGGAYDHLVNSIANDADWTQGDVSAWEEMDNDQRYLALMESGFSGLTGGVDDMDMGTLYYARSKKELMSSLAEEMANEVAGYGGQSTKSFTIGYKDGSIKSYSDLGSSYDLKKLTNNQGWTTQQATVSSIVKSKDINYILYQDGFSQPRYYAKNEAALNQLKKYGDFEVWKKGRGEKRRDYIQDDWI